MSDPIYKNSVSLGNSKSDVIINTAGKVIIKVKDRYYTLDYNTDPEKIEEKEAEILTDLIILKTDGEVEEVINTLTKDSVIITAENTMYLYLDNTIYPFDFNNTGSTVFNDITVNNKLSINGALEIKSSNIVQNLNAQYLNGNTSDVFVKVNLPQTISETWTFVSNIFFNKNISDPSQKTLLNFETSSLVIDNITVKNLTVTSEDNETDNKTDNANIKIDYIKAQTFLGEGSNILSSEEVSKEEVSWNENWANGGDAIVELIISAINEEQLAEHYTNEEDDSYSYYINRLLDVSTNSSFSNLISVTEDMFYENDETEIMPYQSYYYRPKNIDSTWINTPYGDSSNAKIGIYDNWFDKNNYITELATFTGLIWNIELSNNPYKIGEEVKYETDFGTIYGLVTRTFEKNVVIITDGEDCDELYNQDSNEYETCYVNYTPITNSVLLPAKSGQSVIGNISGIENSIFGTLEGYGLTSEGNCYFVNPGIALVNTDGLNYLKLTNKDRSFIGKNSVGEFFITVGVDGSSAIQRTKMYNINNNTPACYFGPLIIKDDGSATIGSGETQITITADGKVQIPEACIIK